MELLGMSLSYEIALRLLDGDNPDSPQPISQSLMGRREQIR